jgi:hypothetical protein
MQVNVLVGYHFIDEFLKIFHAESRVDVRSRLSDSGFLMTSLFCMRILAEGIRVFAVDSIRK